VLKTAVVHEWVEAHGGAENVAEELADTLDADVFCLWRDDPERLSGHAVHESWMARNQFLRRNKAAALPLMPSTWARTDLSSYDRVVVSSHCFAHQVAASRHQRDLAAYVYVHTPARYLWDRQVDHRGDQWWVRAAAAPLRRLDRSRVAQQAQFAANSDYIRRRIVASWGVDATVIHPPVDVVRIRNGRPWADKLDPADEAIYASLPRWFVLGASRFVTYKRLDDAITVGSQLDLPVVLAGGGPDRARLEARAAAAPVPVTFVDRPSDELLYAIYEAASLFVFTAVEDFGIMPVEAMAAGTPVLVNDVGGARESVGLVGGGLSVSPADQRALVDSACLALALDREQTSHNSLMMDRSAFRERIHAWITP